MHIILAISSLFSNKLKLSGGGRIVVLLLVCGVLAAILYIIGSKIGMKFLGIKYTTYYLLFYLIGWLLQKADTKYPEWISNKMGAISFVVLSVLFAVMLSKESIVSLPDSSYFIAFRFAVSLCGCLIVFYFVNMYSIKSERVHTIVKEFSVYSLELYVVQHILLRHFVSCAGVDITTSTGMINFCMYLCLVIFVCFSIIKVLSVTPITRLLFFGKPLNKKIWTKRI